MRRVFGDTVGGRSLEVSPDEFGRIEFGGIRGEVKGPDLGMGLKKALDQARLVDGASVPEKDKSPLEVLKKVAEESHSFTSADVLGNVEAKVKPKAASSRGEADRANRGDLRPVTGHLKDGSLASNAPGLSDVGDKREAALVEEYQGNLKLLGLFLYAAEYGVSTAALLLRPVPWLASPAFDNSSPWRAELSTRAPGGRKLRNVSGSPGLSEAGSKARWNSRSLGLPSREPLPATSSGARLALEAAQGRAWNPGPPILGSSASDSNGARKLSNNPTSPLSLPALFLASRARWLAGAAAPALFGFHGVSLGQYIIDTLLLRCLIARKLP